RRGEGSHDRREEQQPALEPGVRDLGKAGLVVRAQGARAPLALLAAVLVFVLSSAAHAELRLQPADPTTPPAYVPPGAKVATATAQEPAPPPHQPITRKWWFWTAVGAAVVA